MVNEREQASEGSSRATRGGEMAQGFDPGQALATVSEVARENPHAALAGAFAVGFLLGGGLTPRLLGAAALFAARHYFRVTVEETLASVETRIGEQLGGTSR